MNFIKIFPIVFAFTFIQCSQKNHDQEKLILNGENKPVVKELDWENLDSLSLDKALQQFGKPKLSEKFDMGQGLNEFRIELYNVIRKKEYQGKPLLIQELTWEMDSANYKTVWYRSAQNEWLPVDALVWKKDMQF